MKNLLLLASFFVLITSCTSVQKLVEKGKYDKAINLSLKKLKGKKDKKTKYVKSLERAFAKANARDLKRIGYLKKERQGNYYAEIFDIANRISKRQSRVEPLISLVSKTGYKARFKFVKIEDLIIESKKEAASYHYKKALSYMKKAKKGYKASARDAFYELKEIEKYFADYRDANTLKIAARDLGVENVLLQVKNRTRSNLPKEISQDLFKNNISKLNGDWLRYYDERLNGVDFDYKIDFVINDIAMSPDRELIKEREETKQIEDGFEWEYDKNGKIKTDSEGNKIKKKKYKTVKADVAEIVRTKSVLVEGEIKMKDLRKNHKFYSKPIKAEAFFESFGIDFKGDKKALSKETREKMRNRLEPFPTDLDMLIIASEDIKKAVFGKIRRNMSDR